MKNFIDCSECEPAVDSVFIVDTSYSIVDEFGYAVWFAVLSLMIDIARRINVGNSSTNVGLDNLVKNIKF